MFLWFKFTREERRAMRKKIEMTQEIFDSIMKKREIIGEEAEDLSLQLMIKYPDFLEVNARRICEEYGEAMKSFCGVQRKKRGKKRRKIGGK